MATAVLVVLVVLSTLLVVLAVGIYVTVGAERLNTPTAFAHDGPRPRRAAPRVRAQAVDGTMIVVPCGRREVVLFADHSLLDFEELLEFLLDERAERPHLVVLGSADQTSVALLGGLGLTVSAAVVPHDVYDRYRIRVMPYAVVVDAAGTVVTSGLVNTPFQLRHLAEVGVETASAAAEPTAGTPS